MDTNSQRVTAAFHECRSEVRVCIGVTVSEERPFKGVAPGEALLAI
jgi:hypothetical protein